MEKHIYEYKGVKDGYHVCLCPICGRHKLYPSGDGMPITIVHGDATVPHSGSTTNLLQMGNVDVNKDDSRMGVFDDFINKLTDE